MSDFWTAVAIGVIVPVLLNLPTLKWFLPCYREPKCRPGDVQRIADEYVKNYREGLELGLTSGK